MKDDVTLDMGLEAELARGPAVTAPRLGATLHAGVGRAVRSAPVAAEVVDETVGCG